MRYIFVLFMLMFNLAFAKDYKDIISKDISKRKNDGSLQSNSQKSPLLKIIKIEPTVLFRKDQDGLKQAVDITIENNGQAVDARLKINFRSLKEVDVDLGTIKAGDGKNRFFVPDVSDKKHVEFILLASNRIQDRTTMVWVPRKHWEICMIPISHHDLGYTNPIELVMRKYNKTYNDVIKFCEKTESYPDEAKFRYSIEESWSLQNFIERSDTSTLKKLAKYIKEGRIEVQALYGELVTNMCSHEELIRLMYPSFRINKEYGGQIKVGSITDIPGLSWGLPTVLSGAGINYFFGGMPGYFEWYSEKYQGLVKHSFWDEQNILRPHGKPDAFYWKGPDGSKILVYYQGDYGCWSPQSYEHIIDQLPVLLNDMDSRGNPFSVMRFGGYGCWDNTGTDMIVSNLVREWNNKWAFPKLIVATNALFFEKLEKQCKDLRTFTGELPDSDYPVGALSSSKETTLNRVTHNKISSAEKIATMSHLLVNSKYPSEDIRDVYHNMMLYDEHCWGMYDLIGDEMIWAFNEKRLYAYKAAGLTEKISSGVGDMYDRSSYAGNASDIARAISLKDKGQYIVVFNTLSFSRNDIVNLPNFHYNENFEIIDIGTGQKIPYQVIELDNPMLPVIHAAERYAGSQFNPPLGINLTFVANNVPAMGYKTYEIVPGGNSSVASTDLVLTNTTIENRFFKITLDPETGTVSSIWDKESSTELVDNTAPHQVNQLITRWIKSGKEESPKAATIYKGQNGPVYASLLVTSSGAGCPQLTQEIKLYDNIKRIDFSNRVLKDMTPTMEVYFAFPFSMDNPDFRFEGPLSVIKPLRDQFPGSNSNYYSVQHWADVSDGNRGITLTPIDAHLIEFGGLNSSEISQAHHAVKPITYGAPFVTEFKKGHMYSFVINNNYRTNMPPVQLGDILFRYSITSHPGNWIDGRSRDFGWAVQNPLIAVHQIGQSKGNLPASFSFCQVDKPNVILLTLKKSEDDEGIIIRLCETEGRDTEVNITFPEISIGRAYETNLVEENEKILNTKEHVISTNIKSFGVKTIKICDAFYKNNEMKRTF